MFPGLLPGSGPMPNMPGGQIAPLPGNLPVGQYQPISAPISSAPSNILVLSRISNIPTLRNPDERQEVTPCDLLKLKSLPSGTMPYINNASACLSSAQAAACCALADMPGAKSLTFAAMPAITRHLACCLPPPPRPAASQQLFCGPTAMLWTSCTPLAELLLMCLAAL